ncbi:Histidine kinase 2 [Linum perenne]
MSVNFKLCRFKGSFPYSFKLRKHKESSDAPDSLSSFIGDFLLVWISASAIALAFIFFVFRSDGLHQEKVVVPYSSGEKSDGLLCHCSASKSYLHYVASFFPAFKIPLLETNDRIASVLEFLYSKKQELLNKEDVSDVCWIVAAAILPCCMFVYLCLIRRREETLVATEPVPQQRQLVQLTKVSQCRSIGFLIWKMVPLIAFIIVGVYSAAYSFRKGSRAYYSKREETLVNMCDERARMLQDQFNVSMNHVHALAVLVSTFHHGKNPSAIDQKTFGEYTERTSFERPLTSGVAYALKVPHSEREQFEKQHGWTIKKMETDDQGLVQDCIPEKLDPAPVQDEYAPVIFSQETVSHIVSIDMMSGKEDRENILRARASGKGVLTSPFKLLKSNHLGVVLTFAVYSGPLPPHATSEQRVEATMGYLGASYDIPSLVEKLLHQLASRETIVVKVYDTTNASASILMYGTDVADDMTLLRISNLDFGDPTRKHEMHCRFKQKALPPWESIYMAIFILSLTFVLAGLFFISIWKIDIAERKFDEMSQLKIRAEAADVAKSQFLATVSHEIRTPMNGVLGMLKMLMDTELDDKQNDYVETAYRSGTELVSLMNEVLDQAKIESGRLELEAVPFDLRSVLDNVFSLFCVKSSEKGIELAVYVSDQVPQVVIGDPGRFRQIITNLVGNSVKVGIQFTSDKGHIFVSVHLADQVISPLEIRDPVLKLCVGSAQDESSKSYSTLSGSPVVNRRKSWENFKKPDSVDIEDPSMIRLLVTVEDTGVGIPLDAQSRIFTPFMQADSSTSRTYGGTGIGLSISKRLVELMGGEIDFVSERNVGSTFSFTACFSKGELSFLDTKWQAFEANILDFRKLRALVIDKKSIRAEVTRYHLERLGISVNTVSSLKAACCFMSGESSPANISMVLIDKDACDEESDVASHLSLRDALPNFIGDSQVNLPKILLLATTITPDERRELKSARVVDAVLMKPLRLGVLTGCLQEALGSGKKIQVKRKKPTILQNLLRGKHILVVDDNAVNRRVAQGALERYGAIVTCVNGGRAAVELLEPPHKFDACFMDRHMPEMDGFEATRQIRTKETQINELITSGEASIENYGNRPYWHTPIMAMTADVMQATSEECRKCGMDDYVAKPFEEEQLYNAVARFFEGGDKSG